MPAICGTFLVFGVQCEPQVHTLTLDQHQALNAALTFACDPRRNDPDAARHAIYKQAFGCASQFAVPCWNVDAMAMLANQYRGPHQDMVRNLAACIATDTSYGGPEPGQRSDDDRGRTVDRIQPQPIKPRPGGAAVKVPVSLAG